MVFTVMYQKQTMSLGCTLLQLFCIYNLCYMQCYLARKICSVLLNQHFPQFVCSVQYGWFL